MADDHTAVYCAVRQASLPDPPVASVERRCSRCRTRVWCAWPHLKVAEAREPGGLTIVCEDCFGPFVEEATA